MAEAPKSTPPDRVAPRGGAGVTRREPPPSPTLRRSPRFYLGLFRRMLAITVVGSAIGLAGGGLGLVYGGAMFWLNDGLMNHLPALLRQWSPWLLVAATVLIPTLGGWLNGVMARHIAERRHHGPADAIQAVQIRDGLIPGRTGILSGLASFVSLGTGAPVGLYGPLVHLGACLGYWLGQWQPLLRRAGVAAVGCGVAGAIATAFQAPIAGVIFAHEVLIRHYSLRVFAPITVAAVAAYLGGRLVFDQQALLAIRQPTEVSPDYLPLLVIIGVAGAVLAMALMQGILLVQRLAGRLPLAPARRPLVGGLLLGLAALMVPEIRGLGVAVVRDTLAGELGFGALLLMLAVRLTGTSLCLGSGFAGGVFGPALVLGALGGAAIGVVADWVAGVAGASSLVTTTCGMAAVVSAVIGAPLTSILVVFELTHNYNLTIAVMVSVVFANLVVSRLFGRSLFDVQLARQGFDLSQGRDKAILEDRAIRQYVSDEVVRVKPETKLATVRYRLLSERRVNAYVVDDKGAYVGTVSLARIVSLEQGEVDPQRPVGDYAVEETLIFPVSTSVWEAMEHMAKFRGESVPVLGPDNRFLGVVFESSVISAYLDQMRAIRREEHGWD